MRADLHGDQPSVCFRNIPAAANYGGLGLARAFDQVGQSKEQHQVADLLLFPRSGYREDRGF